MRVAIAGPTGVLGRNLVPLLLQQGHRVRGLARSPSKIKALFGSEVEAEACDLLAPNVEEKLPSMLHGCQAVMHIATAIPRDFNAPGAWDTNNRLRTEGTQRLLKAALEAGVQRYIQQSISLAYPDRDPDLPCPLSLRCSNQAARDLLDWQPVHDIYPGTS